MCPDTSVTHVPGLDQGRGLRHGAPPIPAPRSSGQPSKKPRIAVRAAHLATPHRLEDIANVTTSCRSGG